MIMLGLVNKGGRSARTPAASGLNVTAHSTVPLLVVGSDEKRLLAASHGFAGDRGARQSTWVEGAI
jgi:hypothetical protein